MENEEPKETVGVKEKEKEERERAPEETKIRWNEISRSGSVENVTEQVVRERVLEGSLGEEERKTVLPPSNPLGMLNTIFVIPSDKVFLITDELPDGSDETNVSVAGVIESVVIS
jgi:hypothetical protein